jgi:thiamine-monophosphate kinase
MRCLIERQNNCDPQKAMDEFELIRRFFGRQQPSSDVIIGIGDDGAVLAPPTGSNIVSVVDTQIAGVHFPASLDAAHIGYRAVAVNLSDIAAMGAKPRWMTLALTLPEADARWLAALSTGIFDAANAFGVSLVGGDTTRGSQLVISVQLVGTIAPGSALTRSGARSGDDIFVTGTVGDAAAGLGLLQNETTGDERSGALIERFCRPQARVEFAEKLLGAASAAIDVSDGLFGDLQKLLQASDVAGTLECSQLPLSVELESLFDRAQAIDLALGGGDDYELCFTAPPSARPRIEAACGATGVRASRIGAVIPGAGLSCTDDGRVVEYRHEGYRHFKEDSAS